MIRNLFGGASKCRTVDVCDIFGDNSGKALYRLDGNANDESGNYHGTETAITYGGGVYERGAVFTPTNSSKIALTNPLGVAYSCSWWVKSNGTRSVHVMWTSAGGNDATMFYYRTDNNTIQISTNYVYTCPSNTTGEYFDGQWHLLTLSFNGTTTKFYKDLTEVTLTQGSAVTKPTSLSILGAYSSAGYYFNGTIDQVRFFNRAITATEVATLFAECAPTSTVDDINPFMDGSLKALYQFNGDANDKTGVYNCTVAGSPTYSTGKWGNAITFNGTTGQLVGNTTVPVTFLTMWVYPTSFGVNDYYVDFRYGTNNGTHLIRSGSGGQLYIYGQQAWLNGVPIVEATTVLPLNKWSMLAVKVGVATLGMCLGSDSTSSPTTIMHGSIDQVRCWSKALTPLEVASLYNETTPLEEPMHKLVDPFKDGSGKALYRLDGNALDESGNYNGTATSVTYGAGQFGRCGVFNGSAYYTLSMATSNNFSISSWIKTTADSRLFGFDNSSGRLGATCIIYSAAKYISFVCTDAGGIYILNCSTPTIPSMDSNFHHVVCTFDGANGKVYFDGAVVHTATSTLSVLPTQTTSYLGRGGFTGGLFNGSIDQTRYFNRALTAGEVSTLYTGENNVL